MPFFSDPEVKTFYSIDKYKTSVRLTPDYDIALRVMFNGDNKINIYETTFLSFLEVIGTIGGTFEIVYLLSFLIFKIIVSSFSKSVFDKEKYPKTDEKEWFTYPPSIALSQKESEKKRKVGNFDEGKTPHNDRSWNYQGYDQIEPDVSKAFIF